jgi:hypothetical protein
MRILVTKLHLQYFPMPQLQYINAFICNVSIHYYSSKLAQGYKERKIPKTACHAIYPLIGNHFFLF